jgi:hypothetical protein
MPDILNIFEIIVINYQEFSQHKNSCFAPQQISFSPYNDDKTSIIFTLHGLNKLLKAHFVSHDNIMQAKI